MTECGTCGAPLSHVNATCDQCLPQGIPVASRARRVRAPEQIIGRDALLQLTFEGYSVVRAEGVPDMVEALRFIAAQENLTFAECLIAEKIVGVARDALAKAGAA